MMGAACSRKVVLANATRSYLAVLNDITLNHLLKTSGSPNKAQLLFKSIRIRLGPDVPQTAALPTGLTPPAWGILPIR